MRNTMAKNDQRWGEFYSSGRVDGVLVGDMGIVGRSGYFKHDGELSVEFLICWTDKLGDLFVKKWVSVVLSDGIDGDTMRRLDCYSPGEYIEVQNLAEKSTHAVLRNVVAHIDIDKISDRKRVVAVEIVSHYLGKLLFCDKHLVCFVDGGWKSRRSSTMGPRKTLGQFVGPKD